MRLSFLSGVLIGAALLLGCSALIPEPARVQPPRAEPLQHVLSNTDAGETVRVIENVWIRWYAVSAEGGLDGIRARLDQMGPKSDVAGRRFDALTSWGIRWGFAYNDTSSGCTLRNANIEVEAVVTLPRLEHAQLLTSDEFKLWQGYVRRLRAHEEAHVNIYRNAARELRDEFADAGARQDCNQLREALSVMGQAKLEAIRAADLRFDAETGHGAVFP